MINVEKTLEIAENAQQSNGAIYFLKKKNRRIFIKTYIILNFIAFINTQSNCICSTCFSYVFFYILHFFFSDFFNCFHFLEVFCSVLNIIRRKKNVYRNLLEQK